MNSTLISAAEERILVFAPLGEDAALACQFLEEAGFHCIACATMQALCQALEDGAGAVLLTQEALLAPGLEDLVQRLDEQPPWSTLPLLVLTGAKAASTAPVLDRLRILETRRGLTFLERPVRIMTLISAVQTALEARRRQYQIRNLLREAEAGIRYRDEFLAMLGHELRNPLAPVRSALDFLQMMPTPDPARLKWGFELIDRQVQHLTHLVNDLLDVARVTQGRIQLRKERVVLADLVSAAVETAQPLIEARQHALTVALPPVSIHLEADPTRLIQVLTNLLNNAAKYTEPRGRIGLTAAGEAGEVVISVRDSGAGIAPAMLPHVFELFTQAGQTLARSQGGLGLGLTLVKRLVEMHGGQVQAFSAGLGRGSEFVVRLPVLAVGPNPAAGAHRTATPTASARHRVLVVDDNVDLAESLAMLLNALGYETRIAHLGQTALDAAGAFQPAVVFLDIGLPDLDGYEVARRLRRTRNAHTCRLIALTGYGREEDIERAKQAGFDRHLIKPATLEELRAVLE